MNNIESALTAVVEGNLDGLDTILNICHDDLQKAFARSLSLTVYRSALIKVLEAWDSKCCGPDRVQQWASFIKRGYVAGDNSGSICPINITYDAADEELIVEIVNRFDEIGDLVDGYVDADERAKMLSSLKK